MAGPQREELVLTAAQSVFGVAVLGNLEVSTPEAVALVTLFTAELISVTAADAGAQGPLRLAFTVVYVVAGTAILLAKRSDSVALVRDGFRTPYRDLGGPR
jgi:cation:H+ antiporter